MKCGIIGAGSRGTALAEVLAKNGHTVCLWSLDRSDCEAIVSKNENPNYLPGVKLNSNITCSLVLSETLQDVELIVLALPSKAIGSCLKDMKHLYRGQTIVLASKGWNASDFSPLSSLVFKELGDIPLVVLSGASHAEEVVKDIPTGVVLASSDLGLAESIQKIFQNKNFKCALSSDVVGVQIMGAFKNLIALACGISDGLEYGVNTKALIITQGLQEIKKIGAGFGVEDVTFLSYAGIGDLYVTCSSTLSRNWNAGRLLSQGHTKQDIRGGLLHMVAEGINMAENIEQFIASSTDAFPLLEMVLEIVNHGANPQESFENFLAKSL